MKDKYSLNISEIFYSLQGEGARAGSANIFIRLQGCKAKDACYASGVRCDTEFESGREWSIGELHEFIEQFDCKNIIWTGGEPAQQLTDDMTYYFASHKYYQAIETSGLLPVAKHLNWVTVSPKVAEHVLRKNFTHVNEIKYVRHKGQEIPQPQITADYFYLSPHSDGFDINSENLLHCIELVKQNPVWRLSVQQHKIWGLL